MTGFYKFSVFKELLKTKDTPYEADLVKIYDRLVKGKSKHIVDLIRAAKTKEEAERLKKTLPCILFGYFLPLLLLTLNQAWIFRLRLEAMKI